MSRWQSIVREMSRRAGGVCLALLAAALLLALTGVSPIEVFRQIARGAFGSPERFADVLVVWVPLILTTSGLLVTFAAGLWNIGVEGQIVMGAIGVTGTLRLLQDASLPAGLALVAALAGGTAAGAAWAALAGVLKTFGGVNEIFGGLGLNFIASAVALWLIFGPWKRPGIGSMSGTEPFPDALWLPILRGFRLSPWALGLAVAAVVVAALLLRRTMLGLRLKAVGRNHQAAFLLGVPTWRHLLLAFGLCGALAGLAGFVQVTAVYHRLIPAISSGYGFIGLLVAMVIRYRPVWAVPVALFFAAITIGGIQLPIALQLDSSLTGVLQGLLVLGVLFADGVGRLRTRRA
jgi:simple sugar transport system permease protein